MSGNYQQWNLDAPGGLNDTMAAVREGLATAQSAYVVTKGEAAQFMLEHGAQVLAGHDPVNAPGRMGDPDTQSDASDG